LIWWIDRDPATGFWVIEFRGEALFETRVTWANRHHKHRLNNPRRLAQFPNAHSRSATVKRPASQFVTRAARIETVKIDCDINIFSTDRFQKLVKVLAPVTAQIAPGVLDL
jgi:hypothetical protein